MKDEALEAPGEAISMLALNKHRSRRLVGLPFFAKLWCLSLVFLFRFFPFALALFAVRASCVLAEWWKHPSHESRFVNVLMFFQ